MTWTAHPHVWMTLKVGFYLLCAVGSGMFALWLMCAVASAIVMTNQRRAAYHRKPHDHRVGGVISP
jgi:hypothetical protein